MLIALFSIKLEFEMIIFVDKSIYIDAIFTATLLLKLEFKI
jgi:hypothetical protein